MFYTYVQNNSGGHFNDDLYAIFVEAETPELANTFAEIYTEVYFDGCSKGLDCSCCGDRWGNARSEDDDQPTLWGESDPLKWPIHSCNKYKVYYKCGTVELFTIGKDDYTVEELDNVFGK